jgi:hypothetical protein
MPQTTGAVTGAAATVSLYSGAAYVDISGSSQSVDAVTATVTTGEAYTFDGNYAITTIGKYEPVEVTVNIVYTETSTEAWQLARAIFEGRTATQVKWVPLGAASGADTYETKTVGYITSIDYPPIDASSAGPIMVSFTVRAPGITYTSVT